MRAPTTATMRPEENQFSEALAWALRRVPGLARDFALLFVRDDDAAERAISSAGEIGVDTRITVRGPSGEVLYPDLSLCGSDRTFQLFVEVKVSAGFQDYPLPDGTRVSQPVIYAHALEGDTPAAGALIRRVGTLSREPDVAPKDHHPLRRRDVGWAEVRKLLDEAPSVQGISGVVSDLIDAIDARILPTPPPPEQVEALLAWGETLLPGVLRQLASLVGGTTNGRATRGREHPYRGGFVEYASPEGTRLRMWVYVSPEATGYSVPGEPDCVYVQPDERRNADDALVSRLGLGFLLERDIVGWEVWRYWVPVKEVQAVGAARAQEAFVVKAVYEALGKSGLIRAA
jgi:hypothetical protein